MFTPVIPTGGLAGWRFLQNTYDAQFDAFTRSTSLKRDTDYFREEIGKVSSAEELVQDRRLLTVALSAFGLEQDINNRALIQRVLEEGSVGEEALATRFADTRYRDLSEAFGFGPLELTRTGDPAFAGQIIDRFEAARFEVAAGDQQQAVRIALYAERVLPDLAAEDTGTDTKWFAIMGDPPLREFFEKALNLPSQIGQIDIDQQLGIFKDRARAVFGSDDPAQFTDPALLTDATTKFMVRDQLAGLGGGLSSGSIALTLLAG